MLVPMLVASLLATSGSVIANAERMSPRSNGSSHFSCCSGVPNCASTSMLPVSGAAQLRTAGASRMERPVISASGAYWRFVRPAPCSPGRKTFHSPRSRASCRSSCSTGAVLHAHRSGSADTCASKTGSEGTMRSSMKVSSDCRSSSVRASNPKSMSLLLDGGEACRDEGDGGLADGGEALADGLALRVAVVDALEDHGELEVGEAEVEREVAEVAAARCGIPLAQLGAGDEAGRPRDVGDGDGVHEEREPLVGLKEGDVGEGVADRRHLPVEHGRHLVVRRDEEVVEPEVAVHDRRIALRRNGSRKPFVLVVEAGSTACSATSVSTIRSLTARTRSPPSGRSCASKR